MLEFKNNRKIYSLLEIATGLKIAIDKSFYGSYWIKAEIVKLNYYPKSGHCFPDLVEKEKGVIKAQMRATIWAGDYYHITKKFKEETKEPLNEGIKILFRAKISFHPLYGLSLNIFDIEPSFTIGEMAKEKTDTISRLKKENIFDNNKLLHFPVLPQRIAVISVETSKGYSDFITTLTNNEWDYKFFHYLFPSVLQGDNAIRSIIEQLQDIKRCIKHFDLVAVIRGGGGDVGLSCYNNYFLSREVAQFPIPVISGIGHSTNETVVEMVSYQNKITPTEVAYFLIQRFHNFSVQLTEIQKTISDYAGEVIQYENKMLNEKIKMFISFTSNNLENRNYNLNTLGQSISFNTNRFINKRKQEIAEMKTGLKYYSFQVLNNQKMNLNNYEGKVKLLDPKNILDRGYSITYFKNKPITDISDLEEGQEIVTQLSNGKIISTVNQINS